MMGQGHLPGINKIDSNPWEHPPKNSVQLKVVPVTVEKAHLRPQLLGIACPDDNHSLRASVQELDHCSSDVPEPANIYFQGEGAKVRPYSYGHHCVLPSHNPIQFICHIMKLITEDARESDGWTVAAIFEQDVVLLVHCEERTNVLGTPQVKLHQIWNKEKIKFITTFNLNTYILNIQVALQNSFKNSRPTKRGIRKFYTGQIPLWISLPTNIITFRDCDVVEMWDLCATTLESFLV